MGDLDHALRAHYAEQAKAELLSVEMPELGITVYFRPMSAMSGREFSRYRQAASCEDQVEGLYRVLVTRARNADGIIEWSMADVPRLMDVISPHDVVTIVNAMADQDTPVSIEDAEKK